MYRLRADEHTWLLLNDLIRRSARIAALLPLAGVLVLGVANAFEDQAPPSVDLTSLQASVRNDGTVTLVWERPETQGAVIRGFNIYQKTPRDPGLSKVNSYLVPGVVFAYRAAAPHTTYCITAVDKDGRESAVPACVPTEIPERPAAIETVRHPKADPPLAANSGESQRRVYEIPASAMPADQAVLSDLKTFGVRSTDNNGYVTQQPDPVLMKMIRQNATGNTAEIQRILNGEPDATAFNPSAAENQPGHQD